MEKSHLALPAGPGPFPGVLVFMEAFGLNDYVKSECDRLARLGYAAYAPDFYRGDIFTYAEFDKVMGKLRALSDVELLADVRAAIATLDAHPAVEKAPYGAVGFCMGGRLAFLCAAELGATIGAAVSFYGGGIAPAEPSLGRPILLDKVASIQAPLQLLYGADDQSIAPEEQARLTQALSAAHKRFNLGVFPGAGHGFASRDRESYNQTASDDAWKMTADFFERYLREPRAAAN
jgi:carboxymethylenebutenolidase